MRRIRTAAARRITALVPAERIERAICFVRGEKVMIDSDLARLYGVPTKVLVQAVKRNASRFPPDFMLELTVQEVDALRSQIVTSNKLPSRGGRRYLPRAFTEQGVAMLSSVLRSERAVRVNVEIIRAFVRLRRMLATHADLARRLTELERKYDGKFRLVFDALRDLMAPRAVEAPRRRIGFRPAMEEHRPRDLSRPPSTSSPRTFSRSNAAAFPPAFAGSASTPPASRRRRRR
jgi:hypothetical protein